jgi:hypothetical protein
VTCFHGAEIGASARVFKKTKSCLLVGKNFSKCCIRYAFLKFLNANSG